MMVGRALLVAPVIARGCIEREVYLPAGTRWYDFWTGELFAGGQTITRPAPWTRPVMFGREGSTIALNIAEQSLAKRADRRAFMIFPPKEAGTFASQNFEHDGISEAYRDGRHGGWRIEIEAEASRVSARVRCFGNFNTQDEKPELIFPHTELRPVMISDSS